ncbi:HNH endonuclease domain-containing protein [Peribacillus sp. SCS-155]|uniref:HNH endonuclease domain-containing protein n=1 Tax=Peribacillus sedimenti TaxID=3115297 RepID=UPI0039059C50
MNVNDFNKEDYWRTIILYGLNQATYKIALGQSLIRFSQEQKNFVSMNELAEDFFDMYKERLKNGKPQLATPNRQTAMERIVNSFNIGKLSRSQAIEKVEREAFNDVIDRFHTVDSLKMPVSFYEKTDKGLVIFDKVFDIFSDRKNIELQNELNARWDLLESAFEIKRTNSELVNDIRKLYLVNGYERTDITKNRSVLNGYQNNVCFYCGEIMVDDDVHVDHVIPRQLINHDDIWNLVLSHGFCNLQKSDNLPDKHYIVKLIERNEYFIKSNHPISNKLKAQLGNTPKQRRVTVDNIYEHAKLVLSPWKGIHGYNPVSDPFYKTFIRNLLIYK